MKNVRLTNEKVRDKFKSQFELVNYAIKLAENMIRTGRGPRIKIETQNPALQILGEIAEGQDRLEPVVETVIVATDAAIAEAIQVNGREPRGEGHSERRKNKLL